VTAPVHMLRTRRQNKYLAAAIDSLGDYHQALQIVDQAEQMMLSLPAPAEVAEPNPLVTGTVTEDWINQSLDRAAEVARREQRRLLLLGVKRDAEANALNVYNTNTNPILAQFDTELHGLLDQVRALAKQLGTATTPTLAIANDLGAQWKQLNALSADYALLRQAQLTVMASHNDYIVSAHPIAGGDDHASDLYLKNLDSLWPSWRNPGQGGERIINVDMSAHRYEPWPTDPTELLLWLATSDAEPWIPTTRELDALTAQRRRTANPNPKNFGGFIPTSLSKVMNTAPKRIARTIGAPNA
jgi:hypothetical protein